MKAIINGKRYDTETAELLAELPSPSNSKRDFQYHDTAIYRTRNGRYFLAGEGGPMSMWARKAGDMWGYGSGIRVVDEEEARETLELCRHAGEEALEKYFAIEDA